jgi:ATP-dependent exoDNAse (exonuclease V) beta subunit
MAFEDLCQHQFEQLGRRYTLGTLLQAIETFSQSPRFKLPFRESGQLNRANAVRLLTVHGAKGLEFNHVHVLWFNKAKANRNAMSFDPQVSPKAGVGLVVHKASDGESTLKHALYQATWHKPRTDLELRRLYYVALTRAKHRLRLYADAALIPNYPWILLPPQATRVVVHHETETPEVFTEAYEQAKHLSPLASREMTLLELSQPSVMQANPTLQRMIHALIPQHALPRYVSFSALHQLERCPAQYWYQHVQGLPKEQLLPAKQSLQHTLNANDTAALRGQALHRMIEAYYRFSKTSTDTELTAMVQQVLAQALGGLPPEEADPIAHDATHLYQRFLQSPYTLNALQANGYEVVGSEYELSFTLGKEATGLNAPYRFRGVVDVLIYNTRLETYGLIDFKTNRTLNEAQRQTYHEQLQMYRLGLASNNPDAELPPAECRLVHLTHEGDVREYPLDAVGFNGQASPWLKQKLNQLEALHYTTTPPDLATHPGNLPCQFCAYTRTCPIPKNR